MSCWSSGVFGSVTSRLTRDSVPNTPSNLLQRGGSDLYCFAHLHFVAIGMLTLMDTNRVALTQTQGRTNMGIRHLTRMRVIQIWFAAVLLAGVAAIASGVAVTVGTVVTLVAMCLAPPAVLLMLWPSDTASTMAEAIDDAKTR